MATYKAPLDEMNFVLDKIVDVGRLTALPSFADASTDTLAAMLEEAAKLIEEQVAPLRSPADEQGCSWNDGRVRLPDGFDAAYRMYAEAGWIGLANDAEYGGLGQPYTVAKAVEEMLCAANVAFSLYPGLTQSGFEAIRAAGSAAQKSRYLPKLANGEWTATMCLTESQAGSDLAAVRTRAIPQADGSYRIEGGKIFISGGEHDLTENTIHIVLARIVDAPAGIRGLSTFIVSKFDLDAENRPGARNAVRCESIEHKMGQHGSCTCTLQFDGARGELLGEPNAGIRNMFLMMNPARILVGVQGLGLCELALQNAARYAADRRQGARPDHSVAIIAEHPDVRRMLLRMRAITEGARVLVYETAFHADIAHAHPDASAREAANDWVELNTPLVKSYCTDAALELGSLAVQVYGGHGYVRDHGVEQILRDAKILALYEGTNGIQANDLVRRKLTMHGGRLPRRFFETLRAEGLGDKPLGFIARPLRRAAEDLEETTAWLLERMKPHPDDAAFGATDYLRAFSLTYLGFNWLRMAKAAGEIADEAPRREKLATAHYFATRMLPEVSYLCSIIRLPMEVTPAEA